MSNFNQNDFEHRLEDSIEAAFNDIKDILAELVVHISDSKFEEPKEAQEQTTIWVPFTVTKDDSDAYPHYIMTHENIGSNVFSGDATYSAYDEAAQIEHLLTTWNAKLDGE